ncbi:MAG: hypothetical protein ACRDSE_07265 [Pseudonocardiaceae bacterium]
MNRVGAAAVHAMASVGDGWDVTGRAVRATPRRVRDALVQRRDRRIGWIAAIVTLVLYLASIGDLAMSPSGRWAGAPLAQFAPRAWFQARAPYLFEPVVELHPGAHVVVFLSPINLLLAVMVAVLVGANIAVVAHGSRQAVACRRPGYGRVLGVLPAFLLGFACCVPTFLLAFGVGTAAVLLPVLLPLRPIFYPLTLVLLTGSLVWGTHRLGHTAPMGQDG